jgi:chromatin segregation and condensation protein Rec8/ScpA/Scc1 (kleisin family)
MMPVKYHPAREAARSAGLKQYETGEKCSKGHSSPRSVSNGNCIACETIGQWLRRHPGKSMKDYAHKQARLERTKADRERRKRKRKHIRAKAKMTEKVVRSKGESPEIDHDGPHKEPADWLVKITTRFLTLLHMEALGAIRATRNFPYGQTNLLTEPFCVQKTSHNY